MVKYLCVAEKPSISKSITQILSGGQFNTRTAASPAWIKNYDFSYRFPPSPGFIDFTVTAVAGHLTSMDFGEEYKGWQSCDPFRLFDLPIYNFGSEDPAQKGIAKNLMIEARKATHLMIWTDCDREGEHIGSEVANVCRKANPRIIVKRAKFSAIIANQINHACRNPVELDMRQARAVEARIELDLRVGASLTRTQTLGLQARIAALDSKVISYGPCQFPTLGFVVDQYERVQAFIPENFWYIHVALNKDDASVPFTWKRNRLFDEEVVEMLYSLCEEEPEATVLSQLTKPTQKWKPLPLTTVELQKTGSRLLHLTPKMILDISDSLYQKGYLSYPRTETDQFDKDFNFDEMIQKHVGDANWGTFATELVNGGFERPRNGQKNDKAHPPIHPTSHVNNLTGNDKKVYDLVVRRFLACCSFNAKGMETTVTIDIAGEVFTAHGLVVLQRNYLEVYIYDKWNGNILPEFQVGETFLPSVCEVKEGQTSRPNLLTEADLVSLMDKNGIGTDATIAEHISKIVEREYVMKQREGNIEYLVPSTLGIGLIEGYNSIGIENSLSKPLLRRLTEHRMQQICDGIKTKQEVIDETLDEYRAVYIKTKQEFDTFVASVAKYVEGDSGSDGGGSDQDDDRNGGGGGGGGGRGVRGGRGAAKGRAAARGAERGARGAVRGAARGAARGGRGGAVANQRRAPSPDDDEDDDDDDDDNDDRNQGRYQPRQNQRQVSNNSNSNSNSNAPKCRCEEVDDLDSVERTVNKEGPNKGKKFWTCSKGQGEGCGFFEWCEEGQGGGGGGGSQANFRKRPNNSNESKPRKRQAAQNDDDDDDEGGNSDRCACDLTPTVRTVTKEGPNTGRRFFVCPNVSKAAQCKYFVWEDEQDGGGGGKASTQTKNYGASGGRDGGGGGSSGECFICHQEGHWSSNCPSKNGGSGSGSRDNGNRNGGGGGMDMSNISCYTCGEQGHFSTNCTGGGGGYSGGRGGSSVRSRGAARGVRARGRGGVKR